MEGIIAFDDAGDDGGEESIVEGRVVENGLRDEAGAVAGGGEGNRAGFAGRAWGFTEGSIGFGWMSCPTEEERNSWAADPHHYTGGRWKYLILKPGQSVFFMPGTIHFVFRVRQHQT